MYRRLMSAGLACFLAAGGFNSAIATASTGATVQKETALEESIANHSNDQLHARAIELARAGKMTEAVLALRVLTDRPSASEKAWHDYLTVLQWSGSNRTMLELFRQRYAGQENNLPGFLLRSVAGAYYQLEQFETAQKYYAKAVAQGEAPARLQQAESAMRAGDIVLANALYDALLVENPRNIAVYLSRSEMAIYRKNFAQAEQDYNKAVSLLSDDENQPLRKQQIDASRAGIYIRTNEFVPAIKLLRPYMQPGQATRIMECDYILALRLRGDYQQVIAESARLWPDLRDIPAYGLQALADAHLRLGQYEQAERVYSLLIEREPSRSAARLGKAYSLVARGRLGDGLALYEASYRQDKTIGSIIAVDAAYFFDAGRFSIGKALYNLLLTLEPDKSSHYREFANSLQRHSMPREAYGIYRQLAALPDGALYGLAGQVKTAVAAGDYRAAKSALVDLQTRFPTHTLTAEALQAYDNRYAGSATFGFRTYNDYKGNHITAWDHSGDQAFGADNWAVLWGSASNRVSDDADHVRVHDSRVGVAARERWWSSRVWVSDYRGTGQNTTGGHWDADLFLRDFTKLNFALAKQPVWDAQAWKNGPIMALARTVSLSHRVGYGDFYDFSYTWDGYSDGNRFYGWSANYSHNVYDRDKKSLDWFLFASRGRYRYESIDYESPPARIGYGVGTVQRWRFLNGYWEWTNALGWGYDKPEPTDFSPYTRLEYGYSFSPSHTLVAGLEYGGRTNRLNNRNGLLYGYRQFDIRYNIVW